MKKSIHYTYGFYPINSVQKKQNLAEKLENLPAVWDENNVDGQKLLENYMNTQFRFTGGMFSDKRGDCIDPEINSLFHKKFSR